MIAPILIISYGNPLRGDDGLGWHAAQILQEEYSHAVVQVIACHQLTPELAEEISQSELVLFIDSSCEGKPGTISYRRIIPSSVLPQSFSHQFDPAMLLTYAKSFYGHAPAAMLFTITGEQFECGEGLSTVVSRSLSEMLTLIRGKIKEYNLR